MENKQIFYAIKVSGQLLRETYSTPSLAEDGVRKLSEDLRVKAAVVPVTIDGKELLMEG